MKAFSNLFKSKEKPAENEMKIEQEFQAPVGNLQKAFEESPGNQLRLQ